MEHIAQMACHNDAVCREYSVTANGGGEKTYHGQGVMTADAEVICVVAHGAFENHAVQNLLAKKAPCLAPEPTAVTAVEQLLLILFYDVVKRLFVVGHGVVGGESSDLRAVCFKCILDLEGMDGDPLRLLVRKMKMLDGAAVARG